MKTFFCSTLVLAFMLIVVFVGAQSPLNVTYNVVQPEDMVDSSGSITLLPYGGVPPYLVTWCPDAGGGSATTISGLKPGLYNVLIQDSEGAQVLDRISLYAKLGWDSAYKGITTNRLPQYGDGGLDFKLTDTILPVLVGLGYDNNLDSFSVDAGFFIKNGIVKAVLEGDYYDLDDYQTNAIIGAVYRVERQGHRFKYYINGYKALDLVSNKDSDNESAGMRGGLRSDRDLDDVYMELGSWVPGNIGVTFSTPLLDFYFEHKSCNVDYNWIYSETYDGNNNPISATMQFYDELGRKTQQQSMNIDANVILCSENRYDAFGRSVLTTLPAPLETKNFCYKENFITVDEDDHGTMIHREYEGKDYDQRDGINTLDNPRPISALNFGELGWYYSDNNKLENRVATSEYPYSRVEYLDDPLGGVKRSSGVGNAFRMGSGHEIRSFIMPESGELFKIYGFQKLYCNAYSEAYTAVGGTFVENPISICDQIVAARNIYKQIVIDQNGEESITFKDMDGKVLATCLSGPENGLNVHTQLVSVTIQPGAHTDIHIPKGCENSLSFDLPISGTNMRVEDINENYKNVTGSFSLAQPAGYYRIYNMASSLGTVTINYQLNYHSFALYYYDIAGRMIGQVPPEGVDYTYNPVISASKLSGNKSIGDFQFSSGQYSGALTVANTLTNAGFNQLTHGVCYLASDATLNGNAAGCYMCYNELGNGSLDRMAASLFDGGLSPIEHSQGIDLNTLLKSGNGSKTQYSIEVNLDATDGSQKVTLGRKTFNAIYLDVDFPNGLGGTATIDGWWLLPSESSFEFDVNQEQNIWSNALSGTILNVTKKEISIVDGVEELQKTFLNYDTYNDPLLSDLNFIVKGRAMSISQERPNHKMIASKQYTASSKVLWSYSSDEGRTDYYYRKDGQIRFSQNQEQRKFNRFSYSNYDKNGRAIEIGEYDPSIDFNGSGVDACANIADNFSAIYFVPQLPNNAEIMACFQSPHSTWSPSLPVRYASLIVDNLDELESKRCKDVIKYTYDLPEDITNLDPGLLNRKQRFIRGRLSKVARYEVDADNSNPYSVFWFSYDELGRKEWEVQYIENIGYQSVDYKYDFNGNVIERILQKYKSKEKFAHKYTYNKNKKLQKVETPDNLGIMHVQARYSYFLHGPLKRTEIASVQGVDYTYTITGLLKAINHASRVVGDPGEDGAAGSTFATDLFGMELDYYDGDYSRNGMTFSDGSYSQKSDPVGAISGSTTEFPSQYNGNIRSVRWNNGGYAMRLENFGTDLVVFPQNIYGFNYDTKRGWMRSAKFGNYAVAGSNIGNNNPYYLSANTIKELDEYYEGNLTYDLNGNINTLKRTGPAGDLLMDDLTYHYDGQSKNKLVYIDDVQINTAITTDLEDQGVSNYIYNSVGEMIEDKGSDQSIDYDSYGRVKAVWNQARTRKKVSFMYNALGQKLLEVNFSNDVVNSPLTYVYYVNDGDGRIERIIETDVQQYGNSGLMKIETPIYGNQRIGIAYATKSSASMSASRTEDLVYEYQLVDHLSNVRVTFKPGAVVNGGTSIEITGYSDYYPMGMVLPRRQLVGANSCRFGYQGANSEKIEELGWNNFDLRNYDYKTGRWTSVDPCLASFSPYVGMSNNWTSIVDPSGGLPWYVNQESGEVKYFHGYENELISGPWVWKADNFYTWEKDGDLYEGYADGTWAIVLPEVVIGGTVHSIGGSFSFAGGGGFEIGWVSQRDGTTSFFWTGAANLGLYLGGGPNSGVVINGREKEFTLDDYEGNGFSVTVSAIESVTYAKSAENGRPTKKYTQVSVSGIPIGPELGIQASWTKTKLFGPRFKWGEVFDKVSDGFSSFKSSIKYGIFKYQ